MNPSEKTTGLIIDAVIDSMIDNVTENETTDNVIDSNTMENVDNHTVPVITPNIKYQMTTTEEDLLKYRSTIMKRGVTPRNTFVVTPDKSTIDQGLIVIYCM